MGIRQRVTDALQILRGQASKAPPVVQSGWGRSWLSADDGGPVGIYSNTPSDWMVAADYFVWATNCVSARANAISSVPLRLYKRSTDPEQQDPEQQTTHPVLELLRQVNDLNLDEVSFKREGERSLCAHGEWVTLIVEDSRRKPAELYILQPSALEPMRDTDNYIIGFNYAGRTVYTPDQLIRIYYPRLDDPMLAQSPTATAIAAINRYQLADRAQETLDQSGGMTRGIIGVDWDKMPSVDERRFMAEWNARKNDGRHTHEDLFLPQGMTREDGVLSAQEQQRESRMDRLKKEVFAAYNVPPSMAGDYSDASVLANADQQEKNFWITFGKAELGLIAEGLNTQLLWRYWPEARKQGLYLSFDTSDIAALQEDELLNAQLEAAYAEVAAQRYMSNQISLNEARKYQGIDEIADERANKVVFPEDEEAKAGEGDDKQFALTGDNMAQVRQIVRDFQLKKLSREQALPLLKAAAPGIPDDAVDTLLKQTETATAEVKSELAITELRPVVDTLDAFNQDMISEPQARTLLKAALPEADENMLNALLTRPQTREQELETKLADANGDGVPDAETPADAAPANAPVETEADETVEGTEEIDETAVGENDEADETEETDETEEMSEDDLALDADTTALLEEAGLLDAAKAFTPRDPDSIKRGPDGKFAPDPNSKRKITPGRMNYNDKPKAKGGKKGGAKKPKKSEAEKEAEREKKKAERKAKRDAERAAKLQADVDALRQALISMDGKDDPSNLRKRLSQQIERVQAKLDAMKSGHESGTQKLLNEAATKAAIKAEAHTGAMIALMLPPVAAQQLLDQVKLDHPDFTPEPADELHITLAYLGKAELLPEWTRQVIMQVVASVAGETAVPLSFTVKGSGRFTNPAGDALWAGVGVEGLQDLRATLVDRLRNAGVNVPNDHGDYQPHVTLAYLPATSSIELPSIQPVRVGLNHMTVMLAGERTDVPLGMTFAMPGADNMVIPARQVSAKAMQIVDFVGMNAIDAESGAPLGVIEKIARFGEHGDITATKAEPVVYVNGVIYRAAAVRVVSEEA